MVCPGHRLPCKMPNCTNHEFPAMGATGVPSEVKINSTSNCTISTSTSLSGHHVTSLMFSHSFTSPENHCGPDQAPVIKSLSLFLVFSVWLLCTVRFVQECAICELIKYCK